MADTTLPFSDANTTLLVAPLAAPHTVSHDDSSYFILFQPVSGCSNLCGVSHCWVTYTQAGAP